MNRQIYRKLYYQKNKEQEKTRAKAWVKKNKKKVAKYKKIWKLNNKDKVRQYELKRKQNENRIEYLKEYKKRPEVIERERARCRKIHPLYLNRVKKNKIYRKKNKKYLNALVRLDINGSRRKYKQTHKKQIKRKRKQYYQKNRKYYLTYAKKYWAKNSKKYNLLRKERRNKK